MGDVRDLLVDIKCWIYEWVSNVCSVVWKDLVLGNGGECRIACQAFWVVKETGLLLFQFLKLAWRILQSTIPWGQIISLKAVMWVWLLVYFLIVGTIYLVYLYLKTLCRILKNVVLMMLYLMLLY